MRTVLVDVAVESVVEAGVGMIEGATENSVWRRIAWAKSRYQPWLRERRAADARCVGSEIPIRPARIATRRKCVVVRTRITQRHFRPGVQVGTARDDDDCRGAVWIVDDRLSRLDHGPARRPKHHRWLFLSRCRGGGWCLGQGGQRGRNNGKRSNTNTQYKSMHGASIETALTATVPPSEAVTVSRELTGGMAGCPLLL